MSAIFLIIEEKIVAEQLAQGKTVDIIYQTNFNNKIQSKKFPNDFTQEQQYFFKQVYDDAVYSSEIGTRIYKVSNNDNNILISIKERMSKNEDDLVIVSNSFDINLKITKFGYNTISEIITEKYNTQFSPENIQKFLDFGITLNNGAKSNNFTIISQLSDIQIEVLKNDSDTYINIGEFSGGKIIILNDGSIHNPVNMVESNFE